MAKIHILPDSDHEMLEGIMARPAELMAGDYYDEHHLAEALGHVIRTLRGWRSRGDGPPYVIVGRRVFYRKDGVRDWLLSKEKASAAA